MSDGDDFGDFDFHHEGCDCDYGQFQDKQGHTFRKCLICHRIDRLVTNGPDDYEWEEAEL